jgi:20S proteasome subunit beta 5
MLSFISGIFVRILGTMAGGAADCSYWIRALSARMQLWEAEEDLSPCAATAAHTLGGMISENRGISVGTMIMGFDEDGKAW